MKIKIELSKLEVDKSKRAFTKVTKEISEIMDEPLDKNGLAEVKNHIGNALTSTELKSFKFGTYESTTKLDENGKNIGAEININLKVGFTNGIINLVEIFYTSIAKFIKNIMSPLEKFIEKYL